jgi:hypothetical protein
MRIAAIIVSCVLFVTPPALARTVEPGSLSVAGGIGPSVRLGSLLDAGRVYLMLQGQGEYAFSTRLSGVGDLSLGIGSALPLRLHLGGRYRLSKLDLPVSPYAQAQLSYGRLFNVLGANLTYVGVRLGAGADYFLTSKVALGGLLALDLGSTTGERPAFYGVVDILGYVSYTF